MDNRMKQWLCPMPGFDAEEFPFIISSGMESFNIVNLKTCFMQALIDTPATYHQSAQGGFFKEDENGISFNYAQQSISESGECRENWFSFTLQPDMLGALKQFGRLPHNSLSGNFEEYTSQQSISRELEQMRQFIES